MKRWVATALLLLLASSALAHPRDAVRLTRARKTAAYVPPVVPPAPDGGGGGGGTIPADVLAYWSFNASNSVDETGNGHNGTDTNVTYGSPVLLGAAAAQFPGPVSGSPANKIVYSTVSVSAGAWSISAWVYPTVNAVTTYEMILGKSYPAGPNSGCGLYFNGVSGAATTFFFGEAFNGFTAQLNPSSGFNHWYHVVATFSGPAGTLKMYVNATLLTTASPESFPNFDPSIIGHDDSDPSGFSDNFQGPIDEVAVFNRVLSQAEVTFIYNGGAGIAPTAPGYP